ncbi:hypothetical protein GCM10028791_42920 [Echinicola sediminis]
MTLIIKKISFLILLVYAVIGEMYGQSIRKELFVFDFEMDQIPIKERVELLSELKIQGVTFAVKNDSQREKYRQYLSTKQFQTGEMSIPVVYFPFSFENSSEDEKWRKTLELPALKSLWVIIQKEEASKEKTLALLKEMTQEAHELGKDIVIYPHDNTFIESVEEAIPYIKEINAPNLFLTMHSCHELRAGNGERMLEVAIKAMPFLKYVSVAGADITLRPNNKANWSDAIKPLDEGDYDINKFLDALIKIGYDGEIFLHTFGIKQKTENHLSRSVNWWRKRVEMFENMPKTISDALDAPENAYWDQETNAWYVSSLGGGKVTLEKDQYGWITKLDQFGKVLDERWVEGLDAPTGMASWKGHLYVGDRGGLVEIDMSKGEIIRKIELPKAEFINDVAIGANGDIFVSDTYANRIYKVSDMGKVEIWLEDEELEFPNGLWVDGDDLIVATWGPMTNIATFETSRKGKIIIVNLENKIIKSLGTGKPIANLDGVVKYKENYYATDWTGGRLLKIDQHGNVKELVTGFNQFADLGIDPSTGIIMVPEMSKNRVIKVNIGAL